MSEHERGELVRDGLATVEEAATFLSIGRSKLYDLMDCGRLPYSKIDRCRRVPWRAVRALAEQSLVGAGADD